MQNKGLIRLFAVLFGIVSIYQLSFTFISSKLESDAKDHARAMVADTEDDYLTEREALETADTEAREKAQALKESGLLAFFDDEVADLRDDITSFRFIAFYNIPKVKFVTDFFFYIVYVVQATYIAINLRRVDPACVNWQRLPCDAAKDDLVDIYRPRVISSYLCIFHTHSEFSTRCAGHVHGASTNRPRDIAAFAI